MWNDASRPREQFKFVDWTRVRNLGEISFKKAINIKKRLVDAFGLWIARMEMDTNLKTLRNIPGKYDLVLRQY